MMTNVLAAVPFIMHVLAVIWVIIAVALILVVLIQKGRGGGLAGAFGGGMASSILGSKTGDFFTWVTIGLVAMFLFLGLLMVKFYKPTGVKMDMPAQSMPAGMPVGDETDSQAPDAQAPAPAETPAQNGADIENQVPAAAGDQTGQ